jgi:hypothetical protein
MLVLEEVEEACAHEVNPEVAAGAEADASVVAGAGIATSLKVLFAAEDCSGAATQEPQLRLERNEVRPVLALHLSKVHLGTHRMHARTTTDLHACVRGFWRHTAQLYPASALHIADTLMIHWWRSK